MVFLAMSVLLSGHESSKGMSPCLMAACAVMRRQVMATRTSKARDWILVDIERRVVAMMFIRVYGKCTGRSLDDVERCDG